MQSIPLFGSGIRAISDIVTRQRRVNCVYDIRVDQDRANVVLLGTPGSAEWVPLETSAVRGWHVVGNLLYVCAGDKLFAITLSGVATEVASGIPEFGNVAMADNSAQLILVTGGPGYVYDISTNVLTDITDPYFPVGATSVTFLNGRFIVENPGTRQFFVSNLLDGLNWTYLGSSGIFGTKENNSDLLVRVGNMNGVLVLWGSQSIEFWQDVGASPLPYQRITGSTQSWGLAATLSAVSVGNTEYFLGFSPDGGLAVIKLNGYSPEQVSDSDLNSLFSSFTTTSDAVALTYTVYGHSIYQITFPSEDRSFAYDVKTGIWHEAQTGVADQGRHFARYGITFGGKNYVSDEVAAAIYVLDKDITTDHGIPIKRQVFTRHLRSSGNVLTLSELFLDFETGVGTPASTPVGQAAYTTPGVYTFTVPDGVTSLSVVCVGGGGSSGDETGAPVVGNAGQSSSFGAVVSAGGGGGGGINAGGAGGTGTAISGSVGGGDGGSGGSGNGGGEGGGGGAGGYSGAGGAGADAITFGSAPGLAGSGGGGGGGASWQQTSSPYGDAGGGGGGVGILGQGASGAGGSGTLLSAAGKGGSSGADAAAGTVFPYNGNNGGLYGGGGGANQYGGPGGGGGGGLRYVNNVSVTPGATYTVTVGAGGAAPGGKGGAGGNGAVRIIWGAGRSFPSSGTADLATQNAATVSEDPQVMVRVSRDGGHTFGNERWIPLGKTGQYYSRVVVRRLGSARDFVVQITMTDPVKFVLASGSVSLEAASD